MATSSSSSDYASSSTEETYSSDEVSTAGDQRTAQQESSTSLNLGNMATSSSSSDYASSSTKETYSSDEVSTAGDQRTAQQESSTSLNLGNMATSSSSSDYASSSTKETYSSDEVSTAGDQRTAQQESSSFTQDRLSDSQDDKGKGIISGAGHFDELTGGTVANPKIVEAESSHMEGINNTQIRMGIDGSLSDAESETDLLCGCCFWEFKLEYIVQCANGHLLCFKCLRKRVKKIIYGGFKADASLKCLDIDGCEESIPLSEIRRALPNNIIETYEYRQAQQSIVEAKVEGLVYCPFCNIPYEVDKCLQVLECPNTKCLQASCIQCKKPNHLPLLCEEVQKMPDSLRAEVEERMTKAVIRECNICHTELIKTSGCNKVTCRCGISMCYVCRQTISRYDHFCYCRADRRAEPGKTCQICNKCFAEDLEEDKEALDAKEVLDAKEEALKELAEKEPVLLDMEIGPAFKKRRLDGGFNELDSDGEAITSDDDDDEHIANM